MEQDSDSSPPVCRWYLQGACRFGDQCRNAHPPDATIRPISRKKKPKNPRTNGNRPRKDSESSTGGSHRGSRTGSHPDALKDGQAQEGKPVLKQPTPQQAQGPDTFASKVKGPTRVTSAPPSNKTPSKPPIYVPAKTTSIPIRQRIPEAPDAEQAAEEEPAQETTKEQSIQEEDTTAGLAAGVSKMTVSEPEPQQDLAASTAAQAAPAAVPQQHQPPQMMMQQQSYPGMPVVPQMPPHPMHPVHPLPPPQPVPMIPAEFPVFSVDVECVATGTGHNARAIAQIGLVDCFGRTLLNEFVRPEKPVVSYLTPLTGITEETLTAHGVPEKAALAKLREFLGPSCVLVGMNIQKDITWLGLKQGKDFNFLIDLATLFSVWNAQYGSFTYFGLDHVMTCWLGAMPRKSHSALEDAYYSMALFNLYRHLLFTHALGVINELQWRTLHTPIAPSFAKQNPIFEGCCMGNKKACTCGDAFFP